nr:hypothetical protein [Ochrobactrum sp. UNC390CL2Tsu3S39]
MTTVPEEVKNAVAMALRESRWLVPAPAVELILTAALPRLPQWVSVKKLEWTAAPNEAGRDGLWFIAIDLLGKKHEVIKSFNGQKGEGWTYGREWFSDLEVAKAAAQADYSARILSALEPSAGRAAVLEEAAKLADRGNAAWLEKRDVTANKKEARDYETMAIACSHVATAIRALSSPDHADAGKVEGEHLPQDVINLVIAAREAFDTGVIPEDEEYNLDKALEPFGERVPYENEPDPLPSAPSQEVAGS